METNFLAYKQIPMPVKPNCCPGIKFFVFFVFLFAVDTIFLRLKNLGQIKARIRIRHRSVIVKIQLEKVRG